MKVLILGRDPDGVGTSWSRPGPVEGNHAAGKCDIVTGNAVIAGDIWFGDGPYKSKDDAKLARSTIDACPKEALGADNAENEDAGTKK